LAQKLKDAGRDRRVKDLYAEPITGGKYIDITNREAMEDTASALMM
jgi:hypothetical protein